MGIGAGIVLAGGRSSRMGSAKAALDWHGTTLLRRVVGVVGRGVAGPVVVVGAPGQELPYPGPGVEVIEDAREGRGPLQALAAGLAAVAERAEVAYASSTDVPLLHPAFVSLIVDRLQAGVDVVLPVLGGRTHPLGAAYRTSLLPIAQELLDRDHLRLGCLYEHCRVLRVTDVELRRDRQLTSVDPELRSLENLNQRADYERARARAQPLIEVRPVGAPAGERGTGHYVHACTLGGAAAAVGLTLDEHLLTALNGEPIAGDPEFALVSGDRLSFRADDARRAQVPASEAVPGG